jgi:hypothetical protein
MDSENFGYLSLFSVFGGRDLAYDVAGCLQYV